MLGSKPQKLGFAVVYFGLFGNLSEPFSRSKNHPGSTWEESRLCLACGRHLEERQLAKPKAEKGAEPKMLCGSPFRGFFAKDARA